MSGDRERKEKKGREQGNERATKSARALERGKRERKERVGVREQDSGDRVQTEDRYRGREGTRVCVCVCEREREREREENE